MPRVVVPSHSKRLVFQLCSSYIAALFLLCVAPPLSQAESHATKVAAADAKKEAKKTTKKARKRPIKRAAGNALKATGRLKEKKKKDPNRLEIGLLPAVNYSIDTGLGFGLLGTVVQFKEGYKPYQWRLVFLLYATVQFLQTGPIFPYHDDYIRLDLPGLAGGLLRLDSRVGFSLFSTSGYYGLGNNSPYKEPWAALDPETQRDDYISALRYQQYSRMFPYLQSAARIKMYRDKKTIVETFVSLRFQYNIPEIYKDSKLEEDIQGNGLESSKYVQNTLTGTQNHGVVTGTLGILWDTRDSEFVPMKGHFLEVSARVGQGLGLPFTYGGVSTNLRFFFSIWKDYLVIATRLIGDVLFGDVPLYELPTFGGLFPGEGPGGGSSTRGVAWLRYYGKAKILGNLELRIKAIPFNIGSQRFNLGFIAFLDAGRVWGDYGYANNNIQKDIDGEGLGIKYGVGGGLRVQWGSTFVIRLDVAQSLSDNRLGFYLNVDHIF
ncbi:MAG: hypothetical protein CL920_05390 [Deltaproteobacteria bacterium]|nr:hypothetical protein [Deltaproteobacteria bacterium]MBU48116.1 hypothetical protein [Deltaproteobacteria bacterium]|tara:strand:- start:54282 stop:55757 length:1476 start_codon:yes stop_codon:yes gene_type:complete